MFDSESDSILASTLARRKQTESVPRRSGDGGAALVEMAFILVLLVTLLAGTVSAAVAYGRDNSIQNAAREASRYGATLPGPIDAIWLGKVRDVARAAATGDLDSTVQGQVICVAAGDGIDWLSLTDTSGSTPPTNTTACFGDGRPNGEYRVQVATQRDTTIQAAVFGIDVSLEANAAARYERTP